MLIIIVVAFILLCLAALYRVVPEGSVHVVHSPEKAYIYMGGNGYFKTPACVPFVGDSVTVYPESFFEVAITNFEVLDINRDDYYVNITATFKIDDYDKVDMRVASFEDLKCKLAGVTGCAARRILSKISADDSLSTQSLLSARITSELGSYTEEWGVLPAKDIELSSAGEMIFKGSIHRRICDWH